MLRKLILAVVVLVIGFVPFALAPMASTAAAQVAAMPTDCDTSLEYGEDDQGSASGCLPTANCMSQCPGVPTSLIPTGHILGVRHAITLPPPAHLDGRPSGANFPHLRPPII